MAFFGRKKEVKVENIPVKTEVENQSTQAPQYEESQFTSPEDLLKMTEEQVNTNVAPPARAKKMESVRPATSMPRMQQMIAPSPQQEKQNFAPLFVKIDRYKNILQSLSELKSMLTMMKNSFAALDQLEQVKNENMNLIANALEKVEQKLVALDEEFLRPPGYQDETGDASEAASLQGVISDLRSQIGQLRADMQQVE